MKINERELKRIDKWNKRKYIKTKLENRKKKLKSNELNKIK